MPVNGQGQFEYPTENWAEGSMRKVGQKLHETALSPPEETKFQEWKKKYASSDTGEDYDLRGAFKAGLKPDPKTGHWPDTYKKPNHPTFSDQSIYAKDRPDLAGRWEGNKYIPPKQRDYLPNSPASPNIEDRRGDPEWRKSQERMPQGPQGIWK